MTRAGMTIGELSARTGFTTKALRYYESVGLLPPPRRTESGYRLYGDSDADRLVFVGKAKRLGLSLEEIRGILAISSQGEVPCVHVLRLLDQHVERVDHVVQQLASFRRALGRIRADARRRLPAGKAAVCRIIEHAVFPIDASALVEAPLERGRQRSAGSTFRPGRLKRS